eukprot:gnl/Spiro4/17597_TR9382_c0_g2_i1.p1 gnl/Spiro4/17597_TR9382_c0_g2~~gnl/Spiro4/17597_TR9382_c0_g2_i1.p1  ORF type:complete len:251 (+),score=52.24 gnl/Spiro4/17597_TR9382_c0_g2_i1:22-753(+)
MSHTVDLPFCVQLPKIELHAHLTGSVRESTVEELYRARGTTPAAYSCFHPSRSLDESFELFKAIHAINDSLEVLHRLTAEVCEDFEQDGCVYLELRSTPKSIKSHSKREYVETMTAAILSRSPERQQRMPVKILLSIDRSRPLEDAVDTVALALAMSREPNSLVVGVDLSGNPAQGNIEALCEVLQRARPLPLALHFAELPGAEECRRLLDLNPDRIGHAVCMDEVTRARVRPRCGDFRWGIL